MLKDERYQILRYKKTGYLAPFRNHKATVATESRYESALCKMLFDISSTEEDRRTERCLVVVRFSLLPAPFHDLSPSPAFLTKHDLTRSVIHGSWTKPKSTSR